MRDAALCSWLSVRLDALADDAERAALVLTQCVATVAWYERLHKRPADLGEVRQRLDVLVAILEKHLGRSLLDAAATLDPVSRLPTAR
jgi:hypothetical protein